MENIIRNKKIMLYAGVLLAILVFVCSSIGTSNNNFVKTTIREKNCNRIYDVNRDGTINFQDAGLAWVYATTPEIHDMHGDLLYDVNMDGQVNFQDAGLIWINRD